MPLRRTRTTTAVTSPSGRMAGSTSGSVTAVAIADPNDNGQDLSTPLGKTSSHRPSRSRRQRGPKRFESCPPAIRSSAQPGLDRVWVLRHCANPWRFSFDRQYGNLWIGDVGEDTREEIDPGARGQVGDRGREGPEPRLEPLAKGASRSSRIPAEPCTVGKLPLHEYAHGDGRCSVTGGFVHRGPNSPRWRGLYIAADWCGRLFVLDPIRDGAPFARSRRVRITVLRRGRRGAESRDRRWATSTSVRLASVRDPEANALRQRGTSSCDRMRRWTGFSRCARTAPIDRSSTWRPSSAVHARERSCQRCVRTFGYRHLWLPA